MNIDYLLVYAPNGKKERLGRENDGGYVIIDLNDDIKYDKFISCGISDDVSFENALLDKYLYLDRCYAYDGTINKIPLDANNKIEFVRKNIGGINSEEVTNLHSEIVGFNNIFLKMDIESHEYLFFALLNTEHMKSFKQIVIEWHFPAASEVTWSILGKLRDTHFLCHLSVNNHCGVSVFNTTDDKLITIPNVFEATYIRKDGQTLERSSTAIPEHGLDQRNVLDKEDIYLQGYPYNTL